MELTQIQEHKKLPIEAVAKHLANSGTKKYINTEDKVIPDVIWLNVETWVHAKLIVEEDDFVCKAVGFMTPPHTKKLTEKDFDRFFKAMSTSLEAEVLAVNVETAECKIKYYGKEYTCNFNKLKNFKLCRELDLLENYVE